MYITEYSDMGGAKGNVVQVGLEDDTAVDQDVTFTATSAQSAAFASTTKFIRVELDETGHIAFGSNPTAVTAQSKRLLADKPEYFGVVGGQKIAAVV